MRKCALLLLCIFLAANLSAQDRNVEAEIRNLEKTESEAVLKNDTITLSRLWDKNFVVNSPDNVVTVAGKSIGQRPVLQSKRTEFVREVEKIVIQEDLAISMGNETLVREGFDAKNPIKRRYTNIWLKKGGEWKLVARHANVICK